MYASGDQASSAVRCIESLRSKIEMYMHSGDAQDDYRREYKPKRRGGRTRAEKAAIKAQMAEAIERIRNGESAVALAAEYGIHERTFDSRLRNRGLSVKKIREKK